MLSTAESLNQYPPQYLSRVRVFTIREQCCLLKQHWPELDVSWAAEKGQDWYASVARPAWVEGALVCLKPTVFGGYTEALERVFRKLRQTGRFTNYLVHVSQNYLRRNEYDVALEKRLWGQQPGDVVVVPCQAGIRHVGLATRADIPFADGEFALGILAESCRALLFPERYFAREHLQTQVLCDQYDQDGGGNPDAQLSFSHTGQELVLVPRDPRGNNVNLGCPTGFAP